MKFEPVIDDSHFAYLAIQKGRLDGLRHDRAAWEIAYSEALVACFASIEKFLPGKVSSILDVGSGLGGIDILLDRHFGGDVRLCLLDGLDDPPVMQSHAQTFSNSRVAADFLRKNGVAGDIVYIPPGVGEPVRCELVVSFGSWCFHYPPEHYLEFVDDCCVWGTILILDVRKDRPAWRRALEARFRPIGVALHSKKFARTVWRVEN